MNLSPIIREDIAGLPSLPGVLISGGGGGDDDDDVWAVAPAHTSRVAHDPTRLLLRNEPLRRPGRRHRLRGRAPHPPSAVRRAPAPRMGRYAATSTAGCRPAARAAASAPSAARGRRRAAAAAAASARAASGTQGFDQSELADPAGKLDAYINNDLEPAGTVPKIITGAMLFSIFSGLAGNRDVLRQRRHHDAASKYSPDLCKFLCRRRRHRRSCRSPSPARSSARRPAGLFRRRRRLAAAGFGRSAGGGGAR